MSLRPVVRTAGQLVWILCACGACAALGCPERCLSLRRRGWQRRHEVSLGGNPSQAHAVRMCRAWTRLPLGRAHLGCRNARLKCCDVLQVAGQLWHLVLVRGGLVQHLTALKDYFLLAKGDFYQALLSEVSNKHPPLPRVYSLSSSKPMLPVDMALPALCFIIQGRTLTMLGHCVPWKECHRDLGSLSRALRRVVLTHMQAKPLMELPPRLATVDASLAQAFQQAGASSSAHEDPLFPSVSAHLDIAEPHADGAVGDSAPAHQVSRCCLQAMRRYETPQGRTHNIDTCKGWLPAWS